MLSLALPGRVFLCVTPTDMRTSCDGLSAVVRDRLASDPLAGDLFVFRNRRGDRLKLLSWDEDGLAVWAKRLEAGRSSSPTRPAAGPGSRYGRPTWGSSSAGWTCGRPGGGSGTPGRPHPDRPADSTQRPEPVGVEPV